MIRWGEAMSELLDLLEARSGVVCAVGAGGKKSVLYHLAKAHRGQVGLTCTVPNAAYPSDLGAHVVVAPIEEIAPAVTEAAASHPFVAFARPSPKRARFGGLATALIDQIVTAGLFDVLFVKADGARMRWIKAPETDEPVIPDCVSTVIPVVSARAIGAPLNEDVAHRVERVEQVTGARRGQRIQPEHLGRLLAHPHGALKNVRDARIVPVINMVDTPELERLARDAARVALELCDRFQRIVLTSLRRQDPLIDTLG